MTRNLESRLGDQSVEGCGPAASHNVASQSASCSCRANPYCKSIAISRGLPDLQKPFWADACAIAAPYSTGKSPFRMIPAIEPSGPMWGGAAAVVSPIALPPAQRENERKGPETLVAIPLRPLLMALNLQ